MSRNVVITAVDGQTGSLLAELLLTNPDFSKSIDSVTGLSLNPTSEKAEELAQLGCTIVPHEPGAGKAMAAKLKKAGADTICVIPPAHEDKVSLTMELMDAAKAAQIPNVCFVSAAGADVAEKDAQPRLREFITLEQKVMESKGDSSTSTGTSPVIVRAGFYAENLLNIGVQTKEGTLPLPIGSQHAFAPVALGDIALLLAHILSSKGENGFSDQVRGQLITLTGPTIVKGEELAQQASQALGTELQFEDVSADEAKEVLEAQATSDSSELEYLLEYYSLVKEGKTSYISTNAFHDITGQHPQQLDAFFEVYAAEFKPEHASKKRKTGGK